MRLGTDTLPRLAILAFFPLLGATVNANRTWV